MRRLLLLPLLTVAAVAQPLAPLDAVADALGGRDRIDALRTVRLESQTRAPLGGASRTVRSSLDLALPDTARWTVRLGGVPQTTWMIGTTATAVVGDSVRVLPEAARRLAEGALWLHPLVLAARRRDLRAEWLADDLLRVFVPGREEPLLIGLNADGRPSRITTFRRRAGRRDYVEVVLRDYREVEGVFTPHRIRQAVRGVVTGEEIVSAVRFGLPLTGPPFEEGG